ncbi:MAG TPA: radical SAM protein [Sumerlaeia bacterium]|nr:radical SAM protein [Sumerlaeia bacterium]
MAWRPPFQRVLLVNPPSGLFRRDDRCQSRVEDQTVRVVFPPIDLAVLGAVVRRAGAEARIGDYPATGGKWEDLERDFEDFGPDAILFNVTAPTIVADLETARRAKRRDNRVLTIARGDIFERAGEPVLRHSSDLDLAFWGEVEDRFERIVRGESPARMEAVVFRDRADSRTPSAGAVRRNAGLGLISDLDSLPLPARDLLDNALYRSPETGNPLTVIQASRGCPARCIFCPAGRLSGHRFRARSPEGIVREIRQCVERFGIREFLFNGDTFTLDKRWVIELCERIIESGLEIRWGCNSRVDSMDRQRAEALRKAGCWVVALGVETGDAELLRRMKKGATLAQAEKAVAVCKEAGLVTHAFFVIGMPWETAESLERTLAFARKLDTDFFDINIAYPLPGAELYDIARAEGLLELESPIEGLQLPLSGGGYATASLRSHTLGADDLTRWRRRALLRLYARPRYVLRTLKRAHQTGALGNYLAAAARRLKDLVRPRRSPPRLPREP